MPQTTTEMNTDNAPETAVIYLRVSSDGQVNKAHDPEGYSIPGQREACEHRAQLLGAEVVGEYVEYGVTGRNVRRPALQRMLGELELIRPTYVIVYDISRLARNRLDDATLLLRIEQSGARLVSVLENIDTTPAGRLTHGVLAAVNEFRSAGDAEKVKMGMARKHASGGTVGKAPIGYLNTTERVEGREVRVVTIDQERAPLVKLAFDAFATGHYSVSSLCDMLDEAGLRTLPTPKRAPAPLSRSNVHYMLRREYYIGVVTWCKAKNLAGRHEALIDEPTFRKVQEILEAHAHSGDRTHKHHHHLKGSIFCGHCGRRLIYSRVRSRARDFYEYFGCISRPGRGQHCEARHIQTDQVEQAVERYYDSVTLTAGQRKAIRGEVERYAGALMQNAQSESARHASRLRELQKQQQKLLHLVYSGKVDEEVLAVEQARIDRERTEAHKWADAAAQDGTEVMQALDEALALLTDPQIAYTQATPHTQRLLNQALFTALLIRDEEVSGAEQTPWVAALRRLAQTASQPARQRQNGQEPRQRGPNGRGPLQGGRVLNDKEMVRPSGLEPPRTKRSTRPSILPAPRGCFQRRLNRPVCELF
jgi:DNA invertase Pin-like site-specific DNA recombinase